MHVRNIRYATAAAVTFAVSFGLAPGSHAAEPIDSSNASVTCTSVTKGVLKAKPALTAAGGLPTILLLSGKLGGCTSPDGITFQEGKSSFRAIINSADNGCPSFIGGNPTTGSITIRWKTNERITDSTSTVTIPSGAIVGGIASVAGAVRGTFDLGSGPPSNASASNLSVTGGFTGGDGGANSGATVVLELSAQSILTLCNSPKGVQELEIGAGALSLD
jgi:hypothetical protein